MNFSDQAERGRQALESAARDRPWLLTLFDVPDRMGGLVGRLGFLPTKKNPNNWWRTFDPLKSGDREIAVSIRSQLLKAGIRGKWKQIERRPSFIGRASSGSGYRPKTFRGVTDFSVPNTSRGWRLKKGRR